MVLKYTAKIYRIILRHKTHTLRFALSSPGPHAKSPAMRSVLIRFITAFLVVTALLAPVAGNMAMAVGLSQGNVLVLCTGAEMRTIVLDAEGNPVEVQQSSDACVLAHAIDTARTPTASEPADRLARTLTDPFTAQAVIPASILQSGQPRAPPML